MTARARYGRGALDGGTGRYDRGALDGGTGAWGSTGARGSRLEGARGSADMALSVLDGGGCSVAVVCLTAMGA